MFPAPRLGTSLFLLLGVIVACGMAFPVMEVKSVDHQKDEISHFQNAKPIGPDFGLDQEKGLPRKTLEETISEVIEEESKSFPKPKKGRNIYRTLKGTTGREQIGTREYGKVEAFSTNGKTTKTKNRKNYEDELDLESIGGERSMVPTYYLDRWKRLSTY